MNALNKTVRYPLHVTISTLFIALVITLGALLSWLNYSKTSSIILSSADKVYNQITQELILDFRGTYRPVAETLQLLALSSLIEAESLEARLGSIRILATILTNQSPVNGIQVGYGNGDYFIVRTTGDEEVRRQFDAPAGAVLMADHVTADAQGRRTLMRIFFDAQHQEIHRKPGVPSEYDPRTRPWYTGATAQPTATKPYLFYFLGKVGTTVSMQSARGGVIVASDVTLDRLSETIRRHQISPDSEVALVSADGQVLAYRDSNQLVRTSDKTGFRIAHLTELGSEVLAYLGLDLQAKEQSIDFKYDGRRWKGSMRRIAKPGGVDLFALMVSPIDELLSEAVQLRWLAAMITALIILLTIPIVWLVARRISNPLRQLAGEAGLISRFDFSSPVKTRSFIREVDELAGTMGLMKTTISQFLTLINSLAGEKDFDSLLHRVVGETMSVSQADGAMTYLVDDNEAFLQPGALQVRGHGSLDTVTLPRFSMTGDHALVTAARGTGSQLLELGTDHSDQLQPLLELLATDTLTLIALPLRNRQEDIIGVLCLLYRENGNARARQQQAGHIAFVEALSGFAAVSLESRHLLMMQEALLDAFIKLIAGAIDSKSPYTGGHCQRVPELTRMLAEAACNSNAPPFSAFRLDDKEWEALDIASWLHDCGKVTTPEYVVDKATKLETIYDRIHEVRMRFEVLKRDAEIAYWEQVANGGDREALKQVLRESWRELDDEFAFVAECNLGGEFMDPDRVDRLQQIARRTWMRTLDDRCGISWEENARKERTPDPALPVEEKLLDDKTEHLVERSEADRMPADNPWGFNLDVPRHKYNRGELYNLCVARGTLTAEERYKINDHIVQTIIMLEKLPYPKHLRDVPLIAGCHHETMDGKGYPKRLTSDTMPLTARMMAIADIFEALTASDRPYKKAKTVSEAVRIMHFMKQDRHIDPDLFDLFLSSGIHLEYGRRFLDPEQIDTVDTDAYLGGSHAQED